MSELIKAMQAAIRGQIGEDRKHGWGIEDSLVVIEAIVAEDATIEIPRLAAAGKVPESYTLSGEALGLIKHFVNPSAARQMLEKAKRPDGLTILAVSSAKRTERATLDFYGNE